MKLNKTKYSALIAGLGIVLSLQSMAFAQSSQCRTLERQLSNASSSNSVASKSLQKAVRQQQFELDKANRMVIRHGCKREVNRRGCSERIDLVRRMEKNLITLQRQLRKSGGSNRSKYTAIKRRMDQLNCRGSISEVKVNSRDKNARLLEQIFGVKNVNESNGRNSDSGRNISPSNSGLYRTMCVRSCDGYYFPISFSTTKQYFTNDADACAARCPRAETQLYYHAMPSSTVEDMMSFATGELYREQPFAFTYRTQKVENCSCGRASFDQLKQIAGSSLLPTDEIKDATGNQLSFKRSQVALPNWRPVTTLSPQAMNAQKGNLNMQIVKQFVSNTHETGTKIANNDNSGQTDASKRVIRLVGPKFFPDQ